MLGAVLVAVPEGDAFSTPPKKRARPPTDDLTMSDAENLQLMADIRRGGATDSMVSPVTPRANARLRKSSAPVSAKKLPRPVSMPQASVSELLAGDADTSIQYLQENPKKRGGEAFERYEKYKMARTVNEAKELGASQGDIAHDHKAGFLSIAPSVSKPARRLRIKTAIQETQT